MNSTTVTQTKTKASVKLRLLAAIPTTVAKKGGEAKIRAFWLLIIMEYARNLASPLFSTTVVGIAASGRSFGEAVSFAHRRVLRLPRCLEFTGALLFGRDLGGFCVHVAP